MEPTQRPGRDRRITIRLDRAVVDYFRSTGRGWQTGMGEMLERIVKRRQQEKRND
jgi:uncharacterized protein (DUF4415 family)